MEMDHPGPGRCARPYETMIQDDARAKNKNSEPDHLAVLLHPRMSNPRINFDLIMNVSGVDMTGDYRTMASTQHQREEQHGDKWGDELPFDPLNDDDDDVDDMLPDRRPSSLREFFTAFWVEFRSLVLELIQYTRAKTWKKKIFTILVTGCSFLVFYDLFFGGFIVHHLESFIFWMSVHSSSAVLAFIVIFVVATCEYRWGGVR